MNTMTLTNEEIMQKPHFIEKNDWLFRYAMHHYHEFLHNGFPSNDNDRWKYMDFSRIKQKSFQETNHFTTHAIPNNALRLKEIIKQHRLKQTESILLVCIDGRYIPELSDVNQLDGVYVSLLSEAFSSASHLATIKQNWPNPFCTKVHPFAALNAALFTDGLYIYVKDNDEIHLPIHLLSIATHSTEYTVHPRHFIVVGKNSKINLLEEYVSLTTLPYVMNIVSTFVVNDHAEMNQVILQDANEHAMLFMNTDVQQRRNSKTKFMRFSFGAEMAREDLTIHLKESGASTEAYGFYQTKQLNQYIDYHVDVNHHAPHTHSKLLYKGILFDQSQAVFNGKVYVKDKAQHVTAHQANHNILLSPTAQVFSKPELEIYAEDVQCKHGATIGQMNEEALFYLRSRGITLWDAQQLLLQGFAKEVIDHINWEEIKQRITGMLTC